MSTLKFKKRRVVRKTSRLKKNLFVSQSAVRDALERAMTSPSAGWASKRISAKVLRDSGKYVDLEIKNLKITVYAEDVGLHRE